MRNWKNESVRFKSASKNRRSIPTFTTKKQLILNVLQKEKSLKMKVSKKKQNLQGLNINLIQQEPQKSLLMKLNLLILSCLHKVICLSQKLRNLQRWSLICSKKCQYVTSSSLLSKRLMMSFNKNLKLSLKNKKLLQENFYKLRVGLSS